MGFVLAEIIGSSIYLFIFGTKKFFSSSFSYVWKFLCCVDIIMHLLVTVEKEATSSWSVKD